MLLWKIDLALDELVAVSLRVGSDVPFLLCEGTALVEGRGEVVTLLQPAGIPGSFVIVVPRWSPDSQCTGLSKTGRLFKHITAARFSSGSRSRSLSEKVLKNEPVSETDLTNVFSSVMEQAFPGWNLFRSSLEQECRRQFALSGAGPAMYALNGNEDTVMQATCIADRTRVPADVFLCRPWQQKSTLE